VSVSDPFFAPSVHPGVWHVPDAQTLLAQSPLREQTLPSAQPWHAPPQSTSVSVPLFTPSPQEFAWQMVFSQTLLAQSVGTPQDRCGPHGAQSGPPQSTSLSDPFFVLSAHVAS
jgi:hypothetical protein